MREAFFFVDINKDGVLTIAEYQRIQGADPRQFARADRNTDGKLSMDEFLKAYGQKTQKHLFSSIYGPATACSWP
jgi:Ca2+-binding EF-hand superfamily protein